MSYNGSGTFVINSTGQPVVTGTVISSSTFNSLTADLGTGLSTAITKDGQTTTTAKIPFAQGISAAVASNFAAGTVGAPSIYLSTDTTTGLYRIGANNDGFAISGVKLLDLGSSLVGITGALTVSTTLGVTGITTLGAALVGPASATVFNTVSTTVNAFGAATTLNIGNASMVGGTAYLYNGNFAGTLGVTGTSTLGTLVVTTGAFIEERATNAAQNISINYVGYNGGTTQFRVLNVYDGKQTLLASFGGFATDTVTLPQKLVVTGTLGVTGVVTATAGLVTGNALSLIKNATGFTSLRIGTNVDSGFTTGGGAEFTYTTATSTLATLVYDRSGGAYANNVVDALTHKFNISNSTVATVASTGLTVTGALGVTGAAIIGDTADNGPGQKLYVKQTSGATTAVAALHNTATTGDNVFLSFGTEAGYTTRGSITYNRAGGLTVYNTTSDYRAKDITGKYEASGETIDQLQVYMGKMKGATISRPMMIAHESAAVVPYAVTGEKDAVDEKGDPIYQSMDHQIFVPLLIAEVQSLRSRVALLESK